MGTVGKSNPNVFNYCHQKGYRKEEYPLPKEKGKIAHVKLACLAAPIPNPTAGDAAEWVAPFQMQVKPTDTSETDTGYAPFMSNGFVRLIGSDKKVPVRIWRDSGYLHTFGSEAILPLSSGSDTAMFQLEGWVCKHKKCFCPVI